MTSNLDAALEYAARGWAVFPCKPDKTPRTQHGFKDATTDADTLRGWWKASPEAAIGIACGASSLVVVDCDVKNGEDGIASWEALGISDAAALHSVTPSGGLHVVYADPTGGEIRNSTSTLAPGVDVRANGGYIIAPPSQVAAGEYIAADDWTRSPGPAPGALVALLTRPEPQRTQPTQPAQPRATGTPDAYGRAALDAEVDRVRSAARGTRNDTLNRAAFALGQLTAGGELSASEVDRELMAAALDAGLPENEAVNTIKSGLAAGAQDPRTRPQPAVHFLEERVYEMTPPPQPEPPPTEHEDAPRPRYVLHTAAEALAPQPPIAWIIADLFSEGSVGLLVGEGGTAKTYSLLDAAVCVAAGKSWLTREITQGAALVIDEESGPRRIARRLGDCLRGHEAGPDTPVYYTTLARFNLSLGGGDVGHLRDAIEETGARFVVIDALVDVMPGGDENSVGDVQPIFIALRSIAADAGAAIVVIHHLNKAGGYRGSSAMQGAVDTMVSVSKNGDEITFKLEKNRDGELFKFAAVGYWEDGRFWLTPVELVPTPPTFTNSEKYVIRYLSEHGASLLDDITNHADVCTEGTAKNAVYALTSKGVTARVDAGTQGQPATYDLTEYGREVAS